MFTNFTFAKVFGQIGFIFFDIFEGKIEVNKIMRKLDYYLVLVYNFFKVFVDFY